ncbi:outer membrane protein [Bartonella sp. CB169]|uniref:outer membrane protein n=1 Tax=Bartonella sp. CB169 TaxID=3112257 RepID=UPI00300E6054
MNVKCLMATSFVALSSAFAAHAADVVAPSHEVAPVVEASTFSWTGFYLGAQAGGFLSKTQVSDSETNKVVLPKEATPKPFGFMAGVYAGANMNIGNGLILGVETDAAWADQSDTKTIVDFEQYTARDIDAAVVAGGAEEVAVDPGKNYFEHDVREVSFTLKEKWSGATRVRLGFEAAPRFLPYVSAGVAYTQVQSLGESKVARVASNIESPVFVVDKDGATNDTNTLFGYTLGAGVDLAMTDKVILRAEYRYADFGKSKYAGEGYKLKYTTNDFRVGVAYKF